MGKSPKKKKYLSDPFDRNTRLKKIYPISQIYLIAAKKIVVGQKRNMSGSVLSDADHDNRVYLFQNENRKQKKRYTYIYI